MMLRAVRVLALVLFTSTAVAQQKSADTLFREGREAAHNGQHEEACRLFSESYGLDPAAGTLLNMALCEEELGRTASARKHYREVMEQSEPSSDRYSYAKNRSQSLESKLAWLTLLHVPSDARVSIDGKVLPKAELAEPVAIDPGSHVVSVVDANGVETRHDVRIAATERRELELSAEVAKTQEIAPPVVTPPMPRVTARRRDTTTQPARTPSRNSGDTQRIVGIALAGGGVVAGVVGAILWQRARNKHDEALDHCQPNCNGTARDLQEDAKQSVTMGNVLAIGGTLLLTSGTVVFLTAPSGKQNIGRGTVSVAGRW